MRFFYLFLHDPQGMVLEYLALGGAEPVPGVPSLLPGVRLHGQADHVGAHPVGLLAGLFEECVAESLPAPSLVDDKVVDYGNVALPVRHGDHNETVSAGHDDDGRLTPERGLTDDGFL